MTQTIRVKQKQNTNRQCVCNYRLSTDGDDVVRRRRLEKPPRLLPPWTNRANRIQTIVTHAQYELRRLLWLMANQKQTISMTTATTDWYYRIYAITMIESNCEYPRTTINWLNCLPASRPSVLIRCRHLMVVVVVQVTHTTRPTARQVPSRPHVSSSSS